MLRHRLAAGGRVLLDAVLEAGGRRQWFVGDSGYGGRGPGKFLVALFNGGAELASAPGLAAGLFFSSSLIAGVLIAPWFFTWPHYN